MTTTCRFCGNKVDVGSKTCPSCGHPLAADSATHTGLLVAMWVLTFAYLQIKAKYAATGGSVCGFASLAIAGYLATRVNKTDQANGLIRLGIGLVTAITSQYQL